MASMAELRNRCQTVRWRQDCQQEGEIHCKEYAAIEADTVIDLLAYGRSQGKLEGAPPDAEDVSRAYKKTAIKLHPDKSPPEEQEMAPVRTQASAAATTNIVELPPPGSAPHGGSAGSKRKSKGKKGHKGLHYGKEQGVPPKHPPSTTYAYVSSYGRSAPDPAPKKAEVLERKSGQWPSWSRTVRLMKALLAWCFRGPCSSMWSCVTDLQSWGRVGVIVIRRVAQYILHWAQKKGYMSNPASQPWQPRALWIYMGLIRNHKEINLATGNHRHVFTFQDFLRNPSLGQHYIEQERAHQDPGGPPFSAFTHEPLHPITVGDQRANNVMGRWANRSLGGRTSGASGCGRTASVNTSVRPLRLLLGQARQRKEPLIGNAGTARCAIGRKPCALSLTMKLTLTSSWMRRREQRWPAWSRNADLERRRRGLNAGQQRTLLKNLANISAVMGGQLDDTIKRTAQIRDRGAREGSGNAKVKATQLTANNDPKYISDLASGMGHVAIQRQRSRLRAVQFQDLPSNDELREGSSEHLLNRLDRLEMQEVRWTTDEVAGCYTMQFLDYFEAHVEAEAEGSAPGHSFQISQALRPPTLSSGYIASYQDEFPFGDLYHRSRAARSSCCGDPPKERDDGQRSTGRPTLKLYVTGAEADLPDLTRQGRHTGE
ncbi:unnamed protein product [Symbiodinium sp. CCMP2592]|nr:unnamed protein product [Symbiodinium sp. CCMP2592]